jgi:hypothetical protein
MATTMAMTMAADDDNNKFKQKPRTYAIYHCSLASSADEVSLL